MQTEYSHTPSYIVLSKDTENTNKIMSLLSTVNIEKHPQPQFDNAKQILQYFEQQNPYFPEILMIDAGDSTDFFEVVWQVRNRFPLANIPIIFIVSTTKRAEDLHNVENTKVVEWTHVEKSLATFVEIALDENFLDPYSVPYHPYTVSLLVNIWKNATTCSLLLPNHRSIEILSGGVQDPIDIQYIQDIISQPPPVLLHKTTSSTISAMGDVLTLGEILFQTIRKNSRSGFLRIRKWLCIHTTETNQHVIKDLPISIELRKFLFTTDRNDTILQRLRTVGLRITQIETEIEILYKMQLLTFSFPEEVHTVETGVITDNTPMVPQHRWRDFLSNTLYHEWQKRENPNPFVAFAWNPQQNIELQITETLERYRVFQDLTDAISTRRYTQLVEYLEYIKCWLPRWVHIFSRYGIPDSASMDTYFLCIRYLQQQQFSLARDTITNMSSPTTLSSILCAWSQFCVHPKEHAKESLETLQYIAQKTLSESSTIDPWIQSYIATIEAFLGNWYVAQTRVEKILHTHNSLQTRQLLWMIQKKEHSNNIWVYRDY